MHQLRNVRRQARSRLSPAFEHSRERSKVNAATLAVLSAWSRSLAKKTPSRFPETRYLWWVLGLTWDAAQERNSAKTSWNLPTFCLLAHRPLALASLLAASSCSATCLLVVSADALILFPSI